MPLHLGAVLIARAWPQQHALADFDHWQQTKHLVDLVRLPGVRRVSYYATRTSGVPQAWQGTGNRMAAYWAEDIDGLKRWMSDPGLMEAIEDGSRFFDAFNELDESTYTGNVYQLGPRWPGDPEPSLEGCLLVQRFEVGDHQREEFDSWVIREHLPALRSIPGFRWAQWGKAVRGTAGAVLQLARQSSGVGGNRSAGGARPDHPSRGPRSGGFAQVGPSPPLRSSRGRRARRLIRQAPGSVFMTFVTLENVWKVYLDGTVAVDSLDLTVEEGELMVLVGPSGCGKSSILRMIAGLEEISAGSLYIGGERVNEVSPDKRNIAMVFQNYAPVSAHDRG